MRFCSFFCGIHASTGRGETGQPPPPPKKTVEIAQLWQHNRGNYTTPRPNANFGGGGEKANRRKKKKKNEKKNFPPGRGPGFSLIFMKKIFPQNREDMSKKGSKKNFSRSARKGPFISRKYVMTWDGNVHQEPNQPFSHVFPRQALALGSL